MIEHTTSFSPFTETMFYLVLFLRYSQLFVENWKFFLHKEHLASPVGVTRLKLHQDLWHQKTTVTRLSYGSVCMTTCLPILIEF